jgi:cytochrome c peroxidase
MKRLVLISLIIFVAAGILTIEACRKSDVILATPITFSTPAGWPQTQYDFANNPLTQQGFELGRKLFYDGKLSKDGNFPCASCHQQIAAFGTFDHDRSHGYNGSHTLRNAPPLQNLAWQKDFGWDSAFRKIEQQVVSHITSPTEMGETMSAVLSKLQADADYPRLFKAAFGDEAITEDRLVKALAQFVVMLVSNNSKYDKMQRGETTFNLAEQLGYDIFKNKCGVCHKEPLFNDLSFRNIGIPVDPFLNDYGLMRVSNKRADSLKFKMPSLRNVQLTYPYGHDGRFFVIDNVLEHYRSSVVNGPTTDPLVANKIPLSNFEIGQLKAFLYTLTDSSFITDPRFAKP